MPRQDINSNILKQIPVDITNYLAIHLLRNACNCNKLNFSAVFFFTQILNSLCIKESSVILLPDHQGNYFELQVSQTLSVSHIKSLVFKVPPKVLIYNVFPL
jgi:hypothetical protein